MQAKASVPVMLDVMEALVASLQHVERLEDRPCKFIIRGSAGIYNSNQEHSEKTYPVRIWTPGIQSLGLDPDDF